MDILYILGRGSSWNNAEIRYSLRSLEKHGKNIRKVYVCGYDPGIFSEEVTVIPCDDPYNCAHKNIMHKIGYAIEHSDIGEEFLLSSDDHFIVKDTDFDNFPYYYKGELESHTNRSASYWRSLTDTYHLLKKEGLTTFSCNPHCNTHFSRTAWKETESIREKAIQMVYGGETNCIMGNWFNAHGKELTYYRDVKIKSFEGKYDILNKIGENHCFSIYDTAIQYGIGSYLNEWFPTPCKYEKEGLAPIDYKKKTSGMIVEGVRVIHRNGITCYHKTR